jgi:prefoldin subunit 2
VELAISSPPPDPLEEVPRALPPSINTLTPLLLTTDLALPITHTNVPPRPRSSKTARAPPRSLVTAHEQKSRHHRRLCARERAPSAQHPHTQPNSATMSSSAAPATTSKHAPEPEPEPRSEQEVLARFQDKRQQVAALAQRLGDLEAEAAEHALVEKALAPMDSSRRCFRMVGDVLVERTVGEVLPAVRRNREGLEGVVGALKGQLDARQRDLAAFAAKWKIRVGGGAAGGGGGAPPAPMGGAGAAAKGPTGVLAGA